MKRILWIALVLSLSRMPIQAIDPPFSQDDRWIKSMEEAELAQAVSGRPLLVVFWSNPNRDTERLENDLKRWKGIPEVLVSYVTVVLKVEENRKLASACQIFSVPSFALIGNSDRPEISERVTGILENTENREEVLRFLQTGAFMDTLDPGALLAEAAQVKSVTQLLHQAELDLDLRKYDEVFEALENAVRLLPSGTSELHLKVHLNLADLNYRAGKFEEAIDSYRMALESLPDGQQLKVALHIFSRLALLLNDQGNNEEARNFLDRELELESDPERLSGIEEKQKAFAAGLYVLAGQGYPGVGLEPPEVAGVGVEGSTGESEEPFEDKIKKVQTDLDFLESVLKKVFDTEGSFPDFLDEIPDLQPADEKIPIDPFSRFDLSYQYLHLQNPEDYILYSVGPDGEDQYGEKIFVNEAGDSGPGDIVRRHAD